MSKSVCHSLDCEESFTPKQPNQKFHSKNCGNRDRQRRHWAKKLGLSNAE